MNNFNQYFLSTIKSRYADFNGKASRSEYWYYVLFYFIISIALAVIDSNLINPTLGIMAVGDTAGRVGVLGFIFSLALFIPSIAVAVRRLHDTGRTGWWLLISLIPLIGILVLLFFLIQKSK